MSKCKITGKVLVIQIGREDTRIALMDSGAQLLSSTTVATPAGAVEDGAIRNADAVRDMLKTALREPEFRRVHQAVFVLSSSQVIAETVTTPDLPAAKLEKLLQANVDSYFPVDMQDYQLVWQTIGRKERSNGAKELSVQLWAVPTAVLSRYYAVGNACGLSVAAVDYCGHSIATAVGASFASSAKAAKERKKLDLNQEISFGKKKNKETAEEETGGVATEVRDVPDTNLYLSLDSELLGMTFVQNGQVVLQRFIRCGDNPAYQAGELAMIVEYFRSLDHGRGSKINGMVFGSGAEDGRLILELEDFLGVQLQVFHTAYDSDMVICAGAARTTMDFGVPSLNAPGKERGRVQSQLWQYGAVLAGGLILIAVVLLLMSARLGWNSSLTTLESNKQMLTIKSQQTAGYADNYNAYVSAYNSYSADWDTVFASMQTYNDNLVLVLEELENMLPTNTSVTNLQIATDGMTVQFACADKEEAAYLIMALRELKYAELNAISNLSGGGGGPATSYGSGKTKEEPPTEGSSETAGTSAIRELIASELTKDELMGLARELSSEDIELLEQVYGQDPVTVYENLRTLKLMNASADQDVFFQQRSAALRELLTGNPFAMNRFLGLLEEDFRRDENAILWWFILDDLGSLGGVDTDDVESLRAFMNDLLAILTKDEETLNATEELLCTDVSVEKWYVYYLEVEMGLTQGEEFPYLNFDAIIEDLLQGGFDTGNDELDAKLNGLISDETWNLLKKLGTEEGMAEMLNKYLTENTTGDATVDAMIESYLTTGTTGYAGVDSRIESYLEGGSMDDEIAAVVEKYITTGTTDNAAMDGLIAAYLDQGTTGNTKLDALIERYINSVVDSITEEQLTQMMGQFISTGTTGNALYDNLLNKYMNTGSTGVDSLDALIQAYLESILGGDNNEGGGNEGGGNEGGGNEGGGNEGGGNEGGGNEGGGNEGGGNEGGSNEGGGNEGGSNEGGSNPSFGGLTEEQVETMLEAYLTSGTTGNAMYDALLGKYLSTGSTGVAALDAYINRYIEKKVNGLTDTEIARMVESYMTTGSTGNKLYDVLLSRYMANQTTGVAALDALIKAYLDNLVGDDGSGDSDSGNSGSGSDGSEGDNGNEGSNSGNSGNVSTGFTKEQVEALAQAYITNGTTGNEVYDRLIGNYLNNGTTGIDYLDELLMNYISSQLTGGGTSSDDVQQIIDSILGGGSTVIGGTGTGTSGGGDTRIYFTVSLGYSDALRNAELIRKGLTYTDKIKPLEVDE